MLDLDWTAEVDLKPGPRFLFRLTWSLMRYFGVPNTYISSKKISGAVHIKSFKCLERANFTLSFIIWHILIKTELHLDAVIYVALNSKHVTSQGQGGMKLISSKNITI